MKTDLGKSARPFVFEAREATEEDIAESNVGREGDRVIPPTEKALVRAKRIKGSNLAKLIALAVHPDERVVVALFSENPGIDMKKVNWQIAVWAGAMAADRRAKEEGVLWNKAFDAIAMHGGSAWNQEEWRFFKEEGAISRRTYRRAQRRNYIVRGSNWRLQQEQEAKSPQTEIWKAEIRDQLAQLIDPLDYTHRVDLVSKWLSSKELSDLEIEQILGFSADKIQEAVGAVVNWSWPEATAKKWLPGRPGLIKGLMKRRKSIPKSSEGPFAYGVAFREYAEAMAKKEMSGGIAYSDDWAFMGTKDMAAPHEWAKAVNLLRESLAAHGGLALVWRKILRCISRQANDLKADQLQELFEIMRKPSPFIKLSPTWYIPLAQCPNTSVETLLGILNESARNARIRETIARHPKAGEKALMDRLSGSNNYRVMESLADKAPGKVFAGMVKRAMKRNASGGMDLIEKRDDAGEFLNPKILAPALMHQNKDTRLKAVKAAGQLKKKPAI